jgi:threonine/homoserine/homoserine lactone efflux protein
MLIFLITFFISFIGSIHPGPLNLSVIQTTLQKGLVVALLMALGGVIPEIIYGYLAVEGVMIFEKYPVVFNLMQWVVMPILLGLGIQQIIVSRQPKKEIISSKTTLGASTREASTRKISKAVFTREVSIRGFFLSLFNPQLLPYWMVILVNYQNYSFLKISDLSDKILFVLGTSTGAFALNYVYAYIAYKQRERVFKYINQNRFEQIIGWTFVLMGLLQGVKLMY